MKNIKLKSFILKEQISISDVVMLEKASKAFAKILVDNKIVVDQHKDLTSADVQAHQYIEDIAEVVRNEVIKWMNVNNARSGR